MLQLRRKTRLNPSSLKIYLSVPFNGTPNPLPLHSMSQYVTRTQRTLLIHSAHSSLGTGHPGANASLSLLKDRYWWPNMARDVRRFVQGCEECAKSKSHRHLPAGKLFPLPIPNRPWSHLGVDFVTDLPALFGNTGILVVVDIFSKSCRLIPLKRLPTAMKTAELMFNHVFRYFGIPEEIVSDRGPQFISRVWKSFFKLLGVTVSLLSGYHPQTNGQTERNWTNLSCEPSATATSTLGTSSLAGPSTLRIPSGNHLLDSLPSSSVLGYQPPMFPWDGEPSDVSAVDYWFRESERVWDEAHHHLQRALRRSKMTADLRRSDAPSYQPGQKVWLSTRENRLHLPCKELAPQIRWPLHHPKADQPGHLPAKPTSTIQNSLHNPCLTPQTLPLSCLSLHRAWLDHGNPSPADPGGWSHLQSDPGFPTSWW